MRETFKFKRILSVFAIVVALMAIPSIGYTMQYDRGFIDGKSQVSELQTQVSILSARMGEMEADLYQGDIVIGAGSGDSEIIELSLIKPSNNGKDQRRFDHARYENPEVGWTYRF